jgi:hypothetical protein
MNSTGGKMKRGGIHNSGGRKLVISHGSAIIGSPSKTINNIIK